MRRRALYIFLGSEFVDWGLQHMCIGNGDSRVSIAMFFIFSHCIVDGGECVIGIENQ